MLLELVRAERVPFEADPLTGLQVLGMLETRLLRFSRVFLVDVTDDRLPGAPIRSPLLPDSLRAVSYTHLRFPPPPFHSLFQSSFNAGLARC